jgi:uncharacterized membrane protein HdeD (DUF308 family)
VSSKTIQKKDVPWWLSIYYLFAGLIYIIISMVIFGLLNSNLQLLLDLLTIVLLLLGISRLLYGIFSKDPSKFIRILTALVGIGIIALSGADFFIRESNFPTQITLLAVGILIISVLRITVGVLDKSEVNWFRIIQISIGTITLTISILFLIFTSWDTSIYVILLAVSFILQGLTKIEYAIEVFEK